ncbi:MAG: NAD dependent epimerase/dehydratase [Candidatus Peregrinibacteria bacterium GW2011_GWA2_33_10]|nr:MAG: NAD dependent epimerase/dehydratase [Candidatus Peregrinibacteria bacterium GW2011_GWA2_33_10]KKP39001.1 MAG: hypothetical protein UR30_C0013G0025 [Candidatus Peregrinibacteria bacterium GW2011_GWC2_33_13]OGJ49832.1 MAG: hypothetical protein A2229_00405 [Candidatus Peregrinibacteria bacterium RIFOXYA2_FULL_33_7]
MKKKSLLILGQGQLGNFYHEYFQEKYQIHFPRIDITKEDQIKKTIKKYKPQTVINAAAKTNIDWCEKNKLQSFEINTLGADNIGKICEEQGIYLVHLSSGCIQESKTAKEVKKETDQVHPLCFYAWTKVWAEELLMDRKEFGKLKVLILRPRQLLSAKASPRNAITKMLTYNRFIDTPNSCTIIEDLMEATEHLIRKKALGIYNIANPGISSPFKIAKLIQKIVDQDMEVKKISKQELNKMTLAKRIDCVLDTTKLKKAGINLHSMEKRLPEILLQFKKNISTPQGQKILTKTQEETRKKMLVQN